jgi:type I restriction enzyme S subunit
VQSGLEELASGSTNQIELNRSTVIATRVPLAPLPEQKRIADKLDAVLARVDACRGRLDRVPAILKRFRQSVLAAATSGELTREWREGAGAEWDEKSIEELCGVERYAMAIGPFGSNLKVADYRSEGVPLVFVREIRARTFGGPATKYVSPEKAVELKAHSVRPGDLLITKMGDPPGDTAIYPLDRPPAIMTADVVCLRVDPHIADSQFVGHAIESPLGRERMGEITAGVAQQKISLERLRTMRLPTPPVREQVEIARRVGELFELADQLERRAIAGRGCVDKLTPSLLAKAFRGELVPQDPSDEPASALLARLKGAPEAGAKKRKGKSAKA